MAFKSPILAGNARLDLAASGGPSVKAAPPADDADAVKRIQRALVKLGQPMRLSFPNGPNQDPDGKFGQETYLAVVAFQKKAFPDDFRQWDGRVGKLTLGKMDALLPPGPTPPVPPIPVPPVPALTHQDMIKNAFDASRKSLRVVSAILGRLRVDIEAADKLDGNLKIIALVALGTVHARDIAVLADKLKVSRDPLSADFRDALQKAQDLVARNITATSTIIDEGNLGRCEPSQFNPPGVPFAATRRTDADPRVSACTPFFAQNPAMQRDVITHEFFHLLGLKDLTIINTTAESLDDANTMAQVAAYLHDRSRQRDSSGLAGPPVPYPMP